MCCANFVNVLDKLSIIMFISTVAFLCFIGLSVVYVLVVVFFYILWLGIHCRILIVYLARGLHWSRGVLGNGFLAMILFCCVFSAIEKWYEFSSRFVMVGGAFEPINEAIGCIVFPTLTWVLCVRDIIC